ncbi:hypothetical protein ACIQUB_01000 [Rhizobium sp. NPDC090275]|uniref:hypothetical protein n=1 Tax=Rhizobium sp. NPDC090275 TaxID=3364498 RepID=UPI00383BB0FB
MEKKTGMKKKSKPPIVEVAVTSEEGRVAVGIMNAEQALELADSVDVEVSHPDHEAGKTDVFIAADELREHPAVAASSAASVKTSEAASGKKGRVEGLETEADLKEHLAALEADAPAEEGQQGPPADYVLEDDHVADEDLLDEEGSLRRLQEEVDNLRARLHVIREQAGTVVTANAKWADASAHEQLGSYPWAKLAGAMAFTFVATRLLRQLPLGAVASAALPLAAAEMRRRYDR